jgi:hypothetical protein
MACWPASRSAPGPPGANGSRPVLDDLSQVLGPVDVEQHAGVDRTSPPAPGARLAPASTSARPHRRPARRAGKEALPNSTGWPRRPESTARRRRRPGPARAPGLAPGQAEHAACRRERRRRPRCRTVGRRRRPPGRRPCLRRRGRHDDVEIPLAVQRPAWSRAILASSASPSVTSNTRRAGGQGGVQGSGHQRTALERRQQFPPAKAAPGPGRQDHGVEPRAFTFRHAVPRLSCPQT